MLNGTALKPTEIYMRLEGLLDSLFDLRDQQLRSAAAYVLSTSLAMAGPDVLLVFDRFGQDIADAFLEVAPNSVRLVTAVYIPVSYQEATHTIPRESALSIVLERSDALITILTDGQASVPFRVALLNAAVANGLSVIHMPGVSDDMFLAGALDVDYESINENARRVAAQLSAAATSTICSQSSRTGETHFLSLSLNGRKAYADGGIASAGEIVNIPTGEAYVSVVEDSAQGSIVVDGSFPDRNLFPGREVILYFSNGRLDLSASHFPKDGVGTFCRSTLASLEASDPLGIRIGELGIGLNPAVKSVEGRTIVDEKTFGTAHIAIGSNEPFGGMSSAPYHLDLVFHPQRILLDESPLDLLWRSR